VERVPEMTLPPFPPSLLRSVIRITRTRSSIIVVLDAGFDPFHVFSLHIYIYMHIYLDIHETRWTFSSFLDTATIYIYIWRIHEMIQQRFIYIYMTSIKANRYFRSRDFLARCVIDRTYISPYYIVSSILAFYSTTS
jgi:hypothetical protein